jgi:hypothetical protein
MTNPIEHSRDPNTVPENSRHTAIDIRAEQTWISQTFQKVYARHGYEIVPEASLVATEDSSVLFTGATITPLKSHLETGFVVPGYCMVQKCLRTKNLNTLFDMNIIPEWTNYFTMCGILAAPGRLHEVNDEAYELLIQELRISPANLLIQASSLDRDLSDFWKDKGVEVVEDSEPQTFYRWKYGMPNIGGRGINILFRGHKEDTYRDLGNVISVEDTQGTVRAYEFGFGLESVLSKMHAFHKPMEASLVSTVIPYEEGPKEKLVNALMTATLLYHHDIEPGRGKEQHVLKKIVKGISFIRRQLDISVDQIKTDSNLFEMAEFPQSANQSGDRLAEGIIAYETQLAKFLDYARNQHHAHTLRADVGEKLNKKLKNQGDIMGICTPDVETVITSVTGGKIT